MAKRNTRKNRPRKWSWNTRKYGRNLANLPPTRRNRTLKLIQSIQNAREKKNALKRAQEAALEELSKRKVQDAASLLKKQEEFMTEIANTPIYIVDGHGCISPKENASSKEPKTFHVPYHTYILSFLQPGDSCLPFEKEILENILNIKKCMYMHDPSEGVHTKKPNRSDKRFHLLSGGIRRVAGGTFEGEPIQTYDITIGCRPPFGVYRVTPKLAKGANRFTKLKPVPGICFGGAGTQILLSDVIQRVYARTGIHRGIFVTIQCQGPCVDPVPFDVVRKGRNGEYVFKTSTYMEEAEQIAAFNANLYNTLKPTVTVSELVKLKLLKLAPRRARIPSRMNKISVRNFKDDVAKGLHDMPSASELHKWFHLFAIEAGEAGGADPEEVKFLEDVYGKEAVKEAIEEYTKKYGGDVNAENERFEEEPEEALNKDEAAMSSSENEEFEHANSTTAERLLLKYAGTGASATARPA